MITSFFFFCQLPGMAFHICRNILSIYTNSVSFLRQLALLMSSWFNGWMNPSFDALSDDYQSQRSFLHISVASYKCGVLWVIYQTKVLVSSAVFAPHGNKIDLKINPTSKHSNQHLHWRHEETMGPWLSIQCNVRSQVRLHGCAGVYKHWHVTYVRKAVLSCCFPFRAKQFTGTIFLCALWALKLIP